MTGCCIFGCRNRSEQGFILKSFPKDKIRRSTWLQNIKRVNWIPTDGSRICEQHFDENQWEQTSSGDNRKLKEDAVPTLFKPSNFRKVRAFDHNKTGNINQLCLQQDFICLPNSSKPNTQEIAVQTDDGIFKDEIARLRKELRRLKQKLQIEKLKNTKLMTNLKFLFNADQLEALKYKNRRFKWCTEKTITKALKIKFVCGTNGYNTLLNEIHFPLPSIRTINRRLQYLKFESGILHEIFDILKIKIESNFNDFEKDCMLTLDEIALKSSVDYDNSTNSFIGKVTLPGHAGLATHALVFMIGGISSRWKQTVGYYFTGDSTNGSEICNIITEIIKRANSIGLTIYSVTSDMGSSNQRMWSSFGIMAGKYSKTVNFIKNPVKQNSPVYFLADAPHLFKNIKQCLINNNIFEIPEDIVRKYNLPNNIVDVKYIEDICEEQESMDLKFAPKLNQTLLDPGHFDKMKVSNAYQVLNHDVSCSLKFIAEEKGDPSANTTAWFVEFIFKWFKLLTSRHPTMALSTFSAIKYEETIAFLEDAIHLFINIKISPKSKGKCTWKPIQTGVILTTTSILDLQRVFLKEKKYSFLLTSRFTQDCLENLFSRIRMRQPLPNPLQFKQILKNICVGQYLQTKPKGSYEEDDREQLSGFVDTLKITNRETNNSTSRPLVLPPHWNTYKKELTHREKNILYNCSGYILRSLSKRVCKKCLLAVGSKTMQTEEYTRFVNLKAYTPGHLFYVNKKTFKIFIVIEQTFMNLKAAIDLRTSSSDLVSVMKDAVESDELVISTMFPKCHNIKTKLIDRFIKYRLRLYSAKVKSQLKREAKIRHESKSLAMRDAVAQYKPKRK